MIRFVVAHWNAVEVIAATAVVWSVFMLGRLWEADHPKPDADWEGLYVADLRSDPGADLRSDPGNEVSSDGYARSGDEPAWNDVVINVRPGPWNQENES